MVVVAYAQCGCLRTCGMQSTKLEYELKASFCFKSATLTIIAIATIFVPPPLASPPDTRCLNPVMARDAYVAVCMVIVRVLIYCWQLTLYILTSTLRLGFVIFGFELSCSRGS